jgi:hypothetical protein
MNYKYSLAHFSPGKHGTKMIVRFMNAAGMLTLLSIFLL